MFDKAWYHYLKPLNFIPDIYCVTYFHTIDIKSYIASILLYFVFVRVWNSVYIYIFVCICFSYHELADGTDKFAADSSKLTDKKHVCLVMYKIMFY